MSNNYGKITPGKPITIRPSKKEKKLKGQDGEYLDIESWKQKQNENIGRTNEGVNRYSSIKTIEGRAYEHFNNIDRYSNSIGPVPPEEIVANGDLDVDTRRPDMLGVSGPGSNLRKNVLHQYASYNYLFTLSGLNETELRTRTYLYDEPHDIIARTGGIVDAKVTTKQYGEAKTGDASGAEKIAEQNRYEASYNDSIYILMKAHDMFVENVNIVSTTGPNAERNLGNFTKMEFEIHEPFSVSFIEKVRAATSLNGYIDYQDAPLLLTIEFKGFDENGKNLSGLAGYTEPNQKRKIPILISRVDLDVDQAGSKYRIVAVPYADLAYDDRYKFPRTDIPVAAKDILEWKAQIENALNNVMMPNEIKEGLRELKDVYEFQIDKEVLEKAGEYDADAQSVNKTQTTWGVFTEWLKSKQGASFQNDVGLDEIAIEPIPKKVEGSASSQISLTKYFEDAIKLGSGYKRIADHFWMTYLKSTKMYSQEDLADATKVADIFSSGKIKDVVEKHQYVDWFKIKTEILTPNPQVLDRITKMSPKKIIYRAVPYKIHVMKFIKPGMAIGKVNWSTKVHKEYNYIYTGENVDVQSLKINYKSAYYMRNVRRDDKTDNEEGDITFTGKSSKGAIGSETYPEPQLPLRTYPSTVKGRSTLNLSGVEGNKSQEFYDYLTNPQADMLRIELEILGDPAYLCQDLYVTSDALANGRSAFNDLHGSFNADAYQPIINVNYRIPDDIDEKEGVMFTNKTKFREENLFFNGLYQVNKIESSFTNGTFSQVLHCSRFNNQQGTGLDPEVVAISGKSISKIMTEGEKEKIRKQKKLDKRIDFMNNDSLADEDGNVPGI